MISGEEEKLNLKENPSQATKNQDKEDNSYSNRSIDEFTYVRHLGEGSFSTVFLATDRRDGQKYAIKSCDKNRISREGKEHYIRREREIMHLLRNVEGIVKMFSNFQDSKSLYFVLTYAPNGELLQHITQVGCFNVECGRHYAAELVVACEQLHQNDVIHRDLKPENILLDEQMHTLIGDFGSAKIYSEDNTQEEENPNADEMEMENEMDDREFCMSRKRKSSFVGTAQYVSPEVLQNWQITPAADLWALGCIIYHMLAGLPPFRGFNDFAVFKEILAYNFEFPENFDQDAAELVRQLLKVESKERLGMQDDIRRTGRYESIRTHNFFKGIDFETLREQAPPLIFPFLPNLKEDSKLKVENVNQNFIDIEKMSECERENLLTLQKSDKWHVFAEGELILKKGLLNKYKGLFRKKCMFLLTTGPHLIYIDPVELMKLGEITWSSDMKVELHNSNVLLLYTTKRLFVLEETTGAAFEWVEAIKKISQSHSK